MREVLAALAAAALAGCASTQTAAPSSAVPTDAQRSTIPGIYLPAGADRDASDTVPGENERWEYAADYLEAVRQEQQLLPVGRSLDGYPWCEKTSLPSAVGTNTTWLWGTARDAVIVSVFEVGPRASAIVVRHITDASLYCGR
jgi:hypothetical protein